MLSKQQKKHVKVALSGDGADELFKGTINIKLFYFQKAREVK